MSFPTTFTENIADKFQETIDPQYVKGKTAMEKAGTAKIITGVAILVASVALVILGIALCATGNLGGIAAIFVSLPLFYVGYNMATIGSNITKIAKNPKVICEWGGWGDLDKEKLKPLLKKGTFGMDVLIDKFIDNNMNTRAQNTNTTDNTRPT